MSFFEYCCCCGGVLLTFYVFVVRDIVKDHKLDTSGDEN